MAFLLPLLLLLPITANAKEAILFVNMNFSEKEQEAMEQIARAKGQELVMVPPKELGLAANVLLKEKESLQKELQRIFRDKHKAAMAFHSISIGEAPPEDSNVNLSLVPATLKTRVQAMPAKLEALNKKITGGGSFMDAVASAAEGLKQKGVRIDRFVASAHSSGVSLFGETGLALSSDELGLLKAKAPEAFQARHVLLLGCYTGTNIANNYWQNMFPSATLITGFAKQAPTRHFPAAWKMIPEILNAADSLDDKIRRNGKDPVKAEVVAAIRRLQYLSMTSASVNYCGHNISMIPDKKGDCGQQWSDVSREIGQAHSIYMGMPPSRDPSRDTSPGTELRELYNRLQSLCAPSEDHLLQLRDQNRVMLFRLLFWWKWQPHFQRDKHSAIQELRREAESLGVKISIPDMQGQLGRIEFTKQYLASLASFKTAREAASKENNQELLEKIESSLMKFESIYGPVMHLDNDKAIPETWVD